MFIKNKAIIEKLCSLFFNFNLLLSDVLKEQKNPKINLNQFRTLNIIRLNKNMTAAKIAEILGITPASMATNLESLVQYGYINQVVVKSDKRQKDLSITLKGRLKLALLAKQVADKISPAKNVLDQKEKDSLLQILSKIDDAFINNSNSI